MNRNVVVISHSEDSFEIYEALEPKLAARGARLLRFDTDRFPMQHHASFRQAPGVEEVCFGDDDRRVVLGPHDAIWYRRAHYGARLPKAMDRQLRAGAVAEISCLVGGLMAAAPCFVLDGADRVHANEHKPMQQIIAREVGLATPRTLMTNDPDDARAFIASCPGGAIAKMLSTFAIYDGQHAERVVFTTAMTPEHLGRLDGIRYAPMVFQERLDKAMELRVTVFGTRIFAAAVDSQRMPGAEVDWREKGLELVEHFTPYTLPPDVEASLHAYMDRVGLEYSAVDFVVEPSGRHVFLEANPAGEFFWLEYFAPNFPFTDALADLLTDQPGARRHRWRPPG